MSGIADEPVFALEGFDGEGRHIGSARWDYIDGAWVILAGRVHGHAATREGAEAILRDAGAVIVQPSEEKR